MSRCVKANRSGVLRIHVALHTCDVLKLVRNDTIQLVRGKMASSDIGHIISREAEFAAEILGVGVTALNKADYTRTAHYAQMFFCLSIGLERAAKLTLCLEHIALNGHLPNQNTFRKYGHKLAILLSEVERVGETLLPNVENYTRLPNNQITYNLVRILSDFSRNVTRYYNLDRISSSVKSNAYDPVAAWYNDVTSLVLINHVTERQLAKIEMTKHDMGTRMDKITLVNLMSEDLEPVTDVFTVLERIGLDKLSKPYTRMYVLQICRFIATVIVEVTYIAQKQLNLASSNCGENSTDLPFMSEIFGLFLCDDSYFRSRKTWTIY